MQGADKEYHRMGGREYEFRSLSSSLKEITKWALIPSRIDEDANSTYCWNEDIADCSVEIMACKRRFQRERRRGIMLLQKIEENGEEI